MTAQDTDPIRRVQDEARWVHRLARGLLRDRHLAADVAQDALIVGLAQTGEKTAESDSSEVAPRSWLFGITRRLAARAVRQQKQRAERDQLAARVEGQDLEQRSAERLRLHEQLTRAARELPEPYRTAVTLRFFDQMPPRRIAQHRGISTNAARQQIHRGLAMLRERLDAEFGDRRAWVVALCQLGLNLRPQPWVQTLGLPRITSSTLLTAAAVLVGVTALGATWWWSTAAKATQPPTHMPETVQSPDELRGLMSQPSQQDPQAPPPNEQGATLAMLQDPAALRAQVERYLQPLTAQGIFAGTVLVARGQDLIVHQAFGDADLAAGRANGTDTRFKLMSTSKAFTAVAVMRLVQAGKLRLLDPVGRHLPGWPEVWRDVTVHDLLDHRSGLPNLEVQWGMAERRVKRRGLAAFPAFLADLQPPALLHAPGEQSRYSNFNFELAGMVAEAASRSTFRELMQREVLTPAGLNATGFDDGSTFAGLATGYFLSPDGAPEASRQDMSTIQAAGGLWSTVGNLHRFHLALAGDKLLSAATQAVMYRPRGGTYACGWDTRAVWGQKCLQHSGGANGYVADFLRFPAADLCIAVLSNYAFAPISRISSDLAAIAFGVERPLPVLASVDELDACTGRFGFAAGSERGTILRRSGRLLVAFDRFNKDTRSGGRLLVPIGGQRFLAPFGDGVYEVTDERVSTPYGPMPRAAALNDAWLPACGRYRVVANGGKGGRGGHAELAHDKGRFVLSGAAIGREIEIVPFRDDAALGMVMTQLGTLMERQGTTLTWTRADGVTMVFQAIE